MSTVAIIDLDGVVADSTARFERDTRPDGSIDWSIAFDSDLVSLDTLMKGADEAIRYMESWAFRIVFLTSRPEHMQAATAAWLAQHGLGNYELICKPEVKKYTKTFLWKAQEVKRLTEQFRADHPSGIVVFIDDELVNRKAVIALGLWISCKDCLDEYSNPDVRRSFHF